MQPYLGIRLAELVAVPVAKLAVHEPEQRTTKLERLQADVSYSLLIRGLGAYFRVVCVLYKRNGTIPKALILLLLCSAVSLGGNFTLRLIVSLAVFGVSPQRRQKTNHF